MSAAETPDAGRHAMGAIGLATCLAELARHYTPQPHMTDPFALILWENVGYLISDDRRAELFEELAQRVGLQAASLASAPQDVLLDIAKRGGMRPTDRVERLRTIGQLAVGAGGDLAAALRATSPTKARTLLKRFPGIGDPGADKILLFAGIVARPALESNGVRAMVRLGYATEGSSYSQAYRNAVLALAELGSPDRDRLIESYQVLRTHGQTLCKRTLPNCLACPLDRACAHLATRNL